MDVDGERVDAVDRPYLYCWSARRLVCNYAPFSFLIGGTINDGDSIASEEKAAWDQEIPSSCI